MSAPDAAPTADVLAVLGRHAPFAAMPAEALRALARRLRLAYHPRGATIAGPELGVADRLHIVKQGRVRGAAPGERAAGGDVALGEGDCFPVGALLGRRATVSRYSAESDCFCWELPAADFHALVESSAPFRAFCMDRMASLLALSQQARRAEAAQVLDEGIGMLAPVASAMAAPAVSCAPDTPVREVIATMHARRIGAMVVAGPGGAPEGIFTTPDVLSRVALPGAAMDTPISRLMTPRPVTVEVEAPLVEAMLAMARHGIRHVVATRDGRVAGVLSERDLFALQRVGLRRTAERIRAAAEPAALAGAADDVRRLARHLLAQGLDAEHVTGATSALNDTLAARLIELVAQRRALPGQGWCWIALGSEGRMEQTLATDQDNALILGAGAPPREAMLAFADEVNRGLAECGFALCAGDIMARNPRWCQPLEEWRRLFDDWIRNPDPQALLHAAIFFDFRALAGDAALAGALREAVLAQARGQPRFAQAMTANALQSRPPLGLLRDFELEDTGPRAGLLDLKGRGARLFVDAARIFALSRGLPATGTAARLRAAAAAGALPQAEASAMVAAFHFIQGLRLKRQYLEDARADGANAIDPERLNGIDRRVLKAALRQAGVLQQRLRLDFAL